MARLRRDPTVRDLNVASEIGSEPQTVHEILLAWRRGRMTTRHAMALTGMNTIARAHRAAASRGVPIRKTLLPEEKLAADVATAAIRKRPAEGNGPAQGG